MKSYAIFAAAAVALGLAAAPVPAQAIGCLSGGAAGAVAGHYAHHHAILGAIGGCIAGHHMHKVQMRNRAKAAETPEPGPASTTSPSGT
jgi:hypothetical protein